MNIAVICEGVSEFKILEHIVTRACGQHIFNAIQPKLTADQLKQDGFGGWQQVLEHCCDETFESIFKFNDYLIIQIDSDSSHLPQYDVQKHNVDGSPKSHVRLYWEIKLRIFKNISREVRLRYRDKILIAICHNEIECWLLPLFYTDARACKTNNCIHTLNDVLSKKYSLGIPDKDKNCDQARKAYRMILKGIRKPADVKNLAKHSFGFSAFLSDLTLIAE